MERNKTIGEIRAALKRRSGKPWSVTGGRGTAWGWIKITAPPARSTWGERVIAGRTGYMPSDFELYDTGEPGRSMSQADQTELAALLGLPQNMVHGGVSIPAQSDYWRGRCTRANGRAPSVCGRPYWD